MKSEQEIRKKIDELHELKKQYPSRTLFDLTKNVEINEFINHLRWVLGEE